MAKIQIIGSEVDISNNAERVIRISITEDQVKDAILMWLRLKDVELPSRNINDYCVEFNNLGTYKGTGGRATFTYRQKL